MYRILPILAASAAALAISPATGSAALPKTCVKGGVCFSKTFSGPRIKLIVTGTAGNDTIVLARVNPTSNNVGTGSVSVNGKDAHVIAAQTLEIVVDGLGGDDHISAVFNGHGQAIYGTETLDGGDGNDVLSGGDRADTMLGGLGTDTATKDPLDKVSGVEILR